MTNEQLAEIVRKWRERVGLTAAEAAERLQIPASTFRNIEYGRGFPYPKLLLAGIRQHELAAHLLKRR